jgi:hypothetical protein
MAFFFEVADVGMMMAIFFLLLIGLMIALIITMVKVYGTTTVTNPQSTTLPNGKIWVGDATDTAAGVFMSGGATMDNKGVVTLSPDTDVVAPAFVIKNALGDEVKLVAPAAHFTGYNWTFPVDNGAANQVLTTDGTLLSWNSASSVVALGYAEFVQTTQNSNASIAPASAVSYLDDHSAGLFDTIGITFGTPGQGTAFNLPVGAYIVDWENSNDAAWSLAIYQGLDASSMTIINETIAGSSSATTWIHGRATIVSAVGNQWMMVSPVTGTHAIPTAGTAAGMFIARITFLKIA